MQVSRVDNKQSFRGDVLAILPRKNKFSTSVRQISQDLNKFLENKDYNVIFSNSPSNDIHTISVADNTLSGAKVVEKEVYNYANITVEHLKTIVSSLVNEYEVVNNYNSFGNRLKRFFSPNNDSFATKLKGFFKI